MELAIINGTYRDSNAKALAAAGNQTYSSNDNSLGNALTFQLATKNGVGWQ